MKQESEAQSLYISCILLKKANLSLGYLCQPKQNFMQKVWWFDEQYHAADYKLFLLQRMIASFLIITQRDWEK